MTGHQGSPLLLPRPERNGSQSPRTPPTPPHTPTQLNHGNGQGNEHEDENGERSDSQRPSASENNRDLHFLRYKDRVKSEQLVIHKAWKRHFLNEISSSGNLVGLFDKYQYWIFTTRFENVSQALKFTGFFEGK